MNFLKGLLIACLIVLQACHYKNLKDQGDIGNSPQSAEQIDFALVMKEVFGPHCVECHSTDGMASFLPLQTYEQVRGNVAAIKAAVDEGSMPKFRAPLSDSLKQILNSWIEAGMPETASANQGPPESSIPTPSPESPAKDWLTVKTLVIDPTCLRCHSTPANRGGVNLETYPNVLKEIDTIDRVVRDGSMPLRGSLTAEQKELILDWIEEGAPEFAAP